MGSLISTIVWQMFSFVAIVVKNFVKSIIPFCVFSLVSSVSICVFLIGGIWGPFISIMFIYFLIFKRLKNFWNTGLYLNSSVFK
jgi:hypothetical protein